jgi:hypothetical protein
MMDRPARTRFPRAAVRTLAVAVAIATAAALTPPDAAAQSYTQLQVLLPGESPAPGTTTGKSGVPVAQTVGTPFSVQIRATDSNWNTVTSITHTVQLDASDETATLPGVFSLVDGEATVSATFNASGSFTITADDLTDTTIPLATSAPVTAFVLNGFEFDRINQKNQYAGVAMDITVTAVDPVGDIVTGFNGDVQLRELTSFGPGRIEPSVVTLSNGEWSGNVTNYRADETSINRGNVNIEASLPSDPSINGLSDPFTVHPGNFARVQIVVPGQAPLPGSISGVSGSPATQAADEPFTVEIYGTDDWWNPVPTVDNVRITSSDPGASTPVTGSLSNGFASFVLSLGTVGTQTLTVTDQTNGTITPMTSAGIQVTASGAHHFEIDPIASPVDAGVPVAVTIRATDSGGNTIVDYAGSAFVAGNTGPGSISPELITFANGIWAGDMTFRGAGGAVSFSVSDFSTPPHTGTSNSFEVLPGPFVGLQVLVDGETPAGGTASGVTGTPDPQNAGSSFNARVRAVDSYWNRVPGVSDLIALSSTDAFAGMATEVSLINGEAVFPVTLYRSGVQTITATDSDNGSINPDTSAGIQVDSGPYAKILLLAPGEMIAAGTAEGRTGAALDQSINYAFNVTVYATDEWFNPVVGVTDLIRITSGDALAELPPDTPLVDGQVELPMRLATGGFQQITATNLSTSMPVSTTQVRAISSGFHLEAEISPTNVQAGEPFTLTVMVTNDAGAVIQEINSTVSVAVRHASTGEDGRGTLLNTSFQLLQGQRAIQQTYTAAEPIVLVVTDDAGNQPAVTEVLQVDPGPPSALVLASDPPWVRGNRTANVTGRVVDEFDNGIPGEPVTFALVEGTGFLTVIEPVTDANGAAHAEFRAPRVPETDRLTGTSGVLSAELSIEVSLVDPSEAAGYVTSYPNPFHPGEAPATIAYKLSADARVTLTFYSLLGTEVRRDVYEPGQPGGREGLNAVEWDGRNGTGDVVASGGYLLVVEAEGQGETLHVMRRRMAVVR